MNCHQARLYLSEVVSKSLSGSETVQVCSHLVDCPDCRVALEKVQRLRGLLSLKRHEQPHAFFYNGFLAEFHRRVYAEVARPKTFWQGVSSLFNMEWSSGSVLRGISFAAAILVLLLSVYVGAVSINSSSARREFAACHSKPKAVAKVEVPSEIMIASSPNTVYVLDRVAQNSPTYANNVLTF